MGKKNRNYLNVRRQKVAENFGQKKCGKGILAALRVIVVFIQNSRESDQRLFGVCE
jgi:hypothetical protein